MKILLVLAGLVFFSCNDVTDQPAAPSSYIKRDTSSSASKEAPNPYATTDISPVDITYFPADYPVKKMAENAAHLPVARIIYSRPHKQGRDIFGNLIKWGEVWRLGANEATELELFQPITIQGKKVAKGRYVLFAIPRESEWTIIFNSNIYSWGLRHDEAKDLYRFVAPATQTAQPIEYFTMVFEKTDSGADMIMTWDKVIVRLPFQFQ